MTVHDFTSSAPRFYSRQEAAKIARRSARWIDHMGTHDSTFPRKIYLSARSVVFDANEFDAWLAARVQEARRAQSA
ncbi:MAG: AlpA family phage regulatory protein [Rhodospirillaceae bacterium]|nr:AlpA family phage regulatory protein [Rhodospirillaceae bacterium]